MGMSLNQVGVYEKKGAIKRKGHGKYLLLDSLDGFHQFKRMGGDVNEEDNNIINYDKERARKTKLEADRLERQKAIDLGDVLSKEEYGGLIGDALSVQKRELKALSLTLQRMVPGMSAKTIEQVEKACARAHNAVLDLQLDDDSESATSA